MAENEIEVVQVTDANGIEVVEVTLRGPQGPAGSGSSVDQTANYSWSGIHGFTNYLQLTEMTDPANGGANTVRFFARDNGSGKTQLCCIFPTGNVTVIATED